MRSSDRISLPDAIWRFFHVHLKDNKKFKDSLYPFVRDDAFLDVLKTPIEFSKGRHSYLIAETSLNKLYNAVLLQGFFTGSQKIKQVFDKRDKRLEAAEL
ncbi:hypothetical protein ACP45A_00560, partial [Vibrio genomosp. F10]